ncbi:hypothetical protein [Chromobacterium vaccinii]|uniref:hypothetical protein n=1 Tax=Chromobacterium vaccinii TaxID=1108595 RepID=UPI00131A0794|nr:hypothetical protein [Chromobacterium vaccinii]
MHLIMALGGLLPRSGIQQIVAVRRIGPAPWRTRRLFFSISRSGRICKNPAAEGPAQAIAAASSGGEDLPKAAIMGYIPAVLFGTDVMRQAAWQRSGISDTLAGGAAALLRGAAVPDIPAFTKKSP